ncbi:MAG: thioesterase family protein [Bacteroidales bacterium]|nr:acyl-CoA thioesterase [Bacteroidales bacterium]MDD2424524.1 thioesterase family protein [Bacteroidales bacterium]MDD3988494.1 thioesterase family protein [Bacteroidales bacterium]MDD4639137.1 thioesterase family protein [Bacteroidales bacterium]
MYTTETKLRVRYYETDGMGVVHHSNYIRYFEFGRDDALVKLGLPLKKIEQELGIMMPVISAECNYKTPAVYSDELTIVSTVKELPRVKIKVETEIFRENGDLVCSGSVTLAFINSRTRKPTRAPAALVSKFEPFFKENI